MPNIKRSANETPHASETVAASDSAAIAAREAGVSRLHRSADAMEPRQRFLTALHQAAASGSWRQLVLSKPWPRPRATVGQDGAPSAIPAADAHDKADADLIGCSRVSVRPLVLRGLPHWSFVYTQPTRDLTRNLGVAAGQVRVATLIDAFAHAHLSGTDESIDLRRSKKGQFGWSRQRTLTVAASSVPDAAPLLHDRVKRRRVDLARPYWVDLGVATAAGGLVPAMARKWKQIDKFIEIFDHAFARSALAQRPPGANVQVVDFGSGKGYLTFALYDHLQQALHVNAEVCGVEWRADLVALTQAAATRSHLEGLHFVTGDVRNHPLAAVDVMVALHACDTATDHALHAGIRAGAAIILTAPCCHKELRPQLQPPAPLRPMLQHGIHCGQEAEMLTDSLRALLLEAEGYAAQVIEFVSLEHTQKNKMIVAVKRQQAVDRAAVRAQIDTIKSFYGVAQQCLESLLHASAPAA